MNQKYMKILVVAIVAICIVGIAMYFVMDWFGLGKTDVRVSNVPVDTVYSSDKDAQHDLIIINENGKYGFANTSGVVLQKPIYDMISLANYGLYYVKSGKNQGFVNSNMQFVFITEEIISSNLSEDFVIYKRDGKSGFINIKSGAKIEAVYETVYDFSQGLAAVQKDGKIGFINTNGDLVIPNNYYVKGLHTFKNGLCSVIEVTADGSAGNTYYIDKAGNRVIDKGYNYGMPFYEGLAFVKTGDMWSIIDENGNQVTDKSFGPYSNTVPGKFSGGYATVIEDGYYGIVNNKGESVLKAEYELLSEVANGRVVFKKGGKFGYMNIDGSVIIAPVYESLSNFKFGVAVYSDQNKYGVIREDGVKIKNAEYKKIELLDNFIIKIYTDEKTYFYTDKNGNIIWEPKN